jgi:hypothetical protein
MDRMSGRGGVSLGVKVEIPSPFSPPSRRGEKMGVFSREWHE